MKKTSSQHLSQMVARRVSLDSSVRFRAHASGFNSAVAFNIRFVRAFFMLLVVGLASAPHLLVAQEIKLTSAVTQIVETVNVPARTSGVLESVNVREGQVVTQNEMLGAILDDGSRLKYERTRTEFAIAARAAKDDTLVRFAQKSLEVTQAELARSENVNQSVDSAVSDTELDHLRLQVSKAKLEVEKSKIDFEVAKLNAGLKEIDLKETKFELSKHEIRSPIAGQIELVERRAGEWIETGQPAFRIVRIDRLRAEGWLGVEEASQIRPNQSAEVTIHTPNRDDVTLGGNVTFISLNSNPVDGKIRVWVEFENPNQSLRPGLLADVVINN